MDFIAVYGQNKSNPQFKLQVIDWFWYPIIISLFKFISYYFSNIYRLF